MDDTTPAHQEPRPRNWLPALAGSLAGLFLVAGILTLFFAGQRQEEFSYFAYAPLSENTFMPGMHFYSPSQLTGYLLIALALCLVSFWVGLRVGRRSR